MAWIESHQELGAHPKTQKLARILGISRPAAVGHLQFLWWWAMDYAQDGHLTRFEPLDIAIGGEWEGDPDLFVDALVRAGFLDEEGETLTIHDWNEYAGRLLEKRRQDAQRKRASRSIQRTSSGQGADVRETARVTVPNLTVPNRTEPGDTPPVSPPAADKPPPTTKQRPHRLPDGFVVTDDVREWAETEGVAHLVDREFPKFCDYWRGAGRPKADWPATLRNWLRRAAEDEAARAGPARASPENRKHQAASQRSGNRGLAYMISAGNGDQQ